MVSSQVIKREMPILLAVTGWRYFKSAGAISRLDGATLLIVFSLVRVVDLCEPAPC